ncbi:MAG: oligosaccharyl transferase, archaeosortase A system-associated, partial [Methanomicrobiales archaeon]|nr:oligosaccharyl transferase, archaeosortase A system-associated [Methanomicrobiales archaeon]
MVNTNIEKFRPYFILILIIILAVFAIWIRLLTMPQLFGDNQFLLGEEPDISYNLRLVEQMIANFPSYPSFEAMTKYPYGTLITWGPLFTFIVTACCILTGAVTKPEIVGVAYAVPPILAAIMIPVMYYLGKMLSNWKTGLISAIFISIVSGQFLYRSLYGFADHHVAEVLFSTIFALAYVAALVHIKTQKMDYRDLQTLKSPLVFGILAGFSFVLGLWTMPTMVLFALITALFTLIQFSIDFYKGKKSDYLLFINIITFLIVILGTLVVGLRTSGFDLVLYSPAHIIAYGLIITGSLILYALTQVIETKKIYYPLSIAVIGVVGLGLVYLLFPGVFSAFIGSFNLMFGAGAVTLTIQELRPWSLTEAWYTFGFGFILALGGIGYTIYRNIKEEKPEQIFLLVWALVILYATFNHVRYEYYLGPVIAILAALVTGAVLSKGYPEVQKFLLKRKKTKPVAEEKPALKRKGKAEKKAAAKSSYDASLVITFFLVAAFGVLFVGMSTNYDYQIGNALGYNTMHPDWRETLEWMGNNTPSPGIDYYTIYNQNTFQYPPQSYGVMSWWDYGHWITFFGHRIPHANPFQEGVVGVNGSASFFISPTEIQTTTIADNLGTKYVITDFEMDTGKFWAMATWYNETLGAAPYSDVFLITSPENPLSYEPVTLYPQNYFETTISRLHNFDGSMTDPSTVYYIVYADGSQQTNYYPVITQAQAMNAATAIEMAKNYNANASTGYHATVSSNSFLKPLQRVPALEHFRLIYESSTNALGEQA